MRPSIIRRTTTAAALATAALLPAGRAAAQSGPGIGVAPGVEHYRFADSGVLGLESITLFTAPLYVQPFATRSVQFGVSAAYAHGVLRRADGSTAELSGPTDTELRLTISPRGMFGASAALLLPTGQSTHSAEQAEVAGVVAADLLPFRVSNWGSGGGADMSATVAVPAGPLNIGARVGYQLTREFEPLDGQPFIYRPGNQLYGRIAVDYNVGSNGKASAHVTVQQFDADEFDGSNLYQAGNRITAIASYAFVAGSRATGAVYAGGLHRAQPTVFGTGPARPTQNLILAGGGVRLPSGAGVFTPAVDIRVFRSDDGLGQGYAAGLGSGAELRAGSATLLPSLRARVGRIVASKGNETTLLGVDAGFGIRFGRTTPR